MDSPTYRVAVASGNRLVIDCHFGHAERFDIYDIDPNGARLIEQRSVEHYCQGGYGDEDKRDVILRTLHDCTACFVARIGDGPQSCLRRAGIEPVSEYAYVPIGTALREWFTKRTVASVAR